MKDQVHCSALLPLIIWSSENDAGFWALVYSLMMTPVNNIVIELLHHSYICYCDLTVHKPIHWEICLGNDDVHSQIQFAHDPESFLDDGVFC